MNAPSVSPTPSHSARNPRVWRRFVAITLIAAAGLVALAYLRSYALASITRAYSSYSGAPQGYESWRRLLASYNVDAAPLRGNLTESKLNPADTLVIAGNVERLSRWEVRQVQRFVSGGGRLVLIGEPAMIGQDRAPTLRRLGIGPERYEPRRISPETQGVTTVRGGEGSFENAPGTTLYGKDKEVVVASLPVGRGTIIFVADPKPMTNAAIGLDDNALYALRLTTLDRPVRFAEGIHGFRDRELYSDVPAGWRLAFLGALLAGVVLMIARARRLGPPEESVRNLSPPRRLFIDAFARALRRAKQPGDSAATIQRAVRRMVSERSGLRPDAPDAVFIASGVQLGLPPEEIAAAIEPVHTERQFVLAARAYARLNQEGERREGTS